MDRTCGRDEAHDLRAPRRAPARGRRASSELPVSRPAVSQHLMVLKGAGLVVDRAVGTRRVYQINPDGSGALRATLDCFWTKSLAAYKAATEQPTEEI